MVLIAFVKAQGLYIGLGVVMGMRTAYWSEREAQE